MLKYSWHTDTLSFSSQLFLINYQNYLNKLCYLLVSLNSIFILYWKLPFLSRSISITVVAFLCRPLFVTTLTYVYRPFFYPRGSDRRRPWISALRDDHEIHSVDPAPIQRQICLTFKLVNLVTRLKSFLWPSTKRTRPDPDRIPTITRSFPFSRRCVLTYVPAPELPEDASHRQINKLLITADSQWLYHIEFDFLSPGKLEKWSL